MTRVSVVVNNYNYVDYLAEAVDSALAQDWADVETIVVDDGSTDGSRDVLAGYDGRVVTVLQENGGQAAAFGAGFAASTGEVVIFLDADDVLLPTAARSAVAAFDGCPGAVMASWQLWVIDRDGVRTGDRYPSRLPEHGDLRDRVIAQGPDSYNTPPTSGNAWSRRFLADVLPCPDEKHFRLGADGYLFVLAPLYGRVVAVDEPQSCYRIHGSNGFWTPVLEEIIATLDEWYEPRLAALRAAERRLGLPVTGDVRGGFRAWADRAVAVARTIRATLPPGAPFVLIDAAEWGGRLTSDPPSIPFTERDGVYWGPPADDAEAVAELRRQAANGVGYVVVGEPAFWYLDHYPSLSTELDLLRSGADVRIYRLPAQS